MKKYILIFLLAIIAWCNVSAQLMVHSRYTPSNDNEVLPVINYYASKPIANKINLTLFTTVNENFAQGLLGISYAPKKWLNIGMSVGIEQSSSKYRFANSLWIGNENQSFLLWLEKGKGADNYFYRATYKYDFDRTFLALNAWRFHGLGPMFGYKMKKLNQTQFWIAPLYDVELEVARFVVGTTIKI